MRDTCEVCSADLRAENRVLVVMAQMRFRRALCGAHYVLAKLRAQLAEAT